MKRSLITQKIKGVNLSNSCYKFSSNPKSHLGNICTSLPLPHNKNQSLASNPESSKQYHRLGANTKLLCKTRTKKTALRLRFPATLFATLTKDFIKPRRKKRKVAVGEEVVRVVSCSLPPGQKKEKKTEVAVELHRGRRSLSELLLLTSPRDCLPTT